MRLVKLSLVTALVLVFSACSCKPTQVEVTKTVQVNVPVKCQHNKCLAPVLNDYSDTTKSLTDRAKIKLSNEINKDAYTKCLEASIKACE